ncbi:zinc finger protein 786 isoform X1 [Psammomys obesus]|uniref:zinc finger protein 786 isoform X1 n=2 Tax=Psammomys obesus TaxID=48139 RepID=UPI00245307C3|nr:zinc finger protein 786 isoform X1 [Psammomys obesus]
MAGPARLPLTFEDVAIYFSEQEWQHLEAWQKELYKHVMRTNYETLVSLDNGLPKPELISWIELGRELFGSPGGKQKLEKGGHSSVDDVHVHLVTEEQLLESSEQAVKSREITCHFQLNAFGLVLGEREDVSLMHDQGISPENAQTRAQGALNSVMHSSSAAALKEGFSSHRVPDFPALQKVPPWQSAQHSCPVCGERSWEKSYLVKHQKDHSKSPSCRVWKKFSRQSDAQQQWDLLCLESGKSFCLKQYLVRHLDVHTRKKPPQCPKCKRCFHHEQTPFSHYLQHNSSQNPKCDRSFPMENNVHQCPQSQERPASWREDTIVLSGQKPGPSLDCEGCCHKGSKQKACILGEDRPCSCTEGGNCFFSRSKQASFCRAHTGEKAFRCPESNKLLCLRGLKDVCLHVHSGDRPLSCRKCGQGFTKHCKLPEHTRILLGEKSFRCAQCRRNFSQRGELLRHQRLPSEEKPFKCTVCESGFQLKSRLRAHQLRHGGQRPFSCRECGRAFTHQCKLREHLRVHSGERPFQCPECHKSFRLKGVLKAHQRTHSKERPFSCGECGKGFTRQSKLTEHFRVHSGERPFRCPECDRSFRLKGQLLSHQRLHTGERPFQCPECGKSYRVKADLKAHQLLHSGQMPFSCQCGKGFAKHSKLVEHMRTHTGEKPFQCPKCDKSFRLKAQLLSHQGLHTGERPFHCPECDKNFRERGHMLRHQRIHRPDRPFACGDCGKGFIYKSKLAEHIRVHTKSCQVPREPEVKKRLSQLFAMIEADWS